MTQPLAQKWNEAAEPLNSISLAGERVRYAVGIKPLLALPRSAHILDAGCGAGRVLRTLAALGYTQLEGLEISFERLKEAARLDATAARYVCSDDVPFEHVENPERWLARLADGTRPGGLVSVTSDTYIWRWLKQLGLYRSIQPLDDAIWPGTLIGWGKRAGLELVQCGGFVNVPDQRHHLGKELLRLLPGTNRLRGWLNRAPAPPMPSGEQAAIVEAIEQLEANTQAGLWAAVWSYESYYWFRKC
ncbi:MAG: methyltransferase domain-containing protein [Chloroflexi bacterium]|nr:methyltransferase domain-containing protein [Chloroflexota bacterium]